MPEFIYYNTTKNRQRRLPVTQFTGLSLPDVDHLSARGPRQHGATYVSTYFRPRELSLQYYVRGCNPAEFELRHRELAAILNPLDSGELRIIGADGTRYTLACRLSAALEVNRFDAQRAEVLAQFIADDPFFYSPAVSQAFTLAVQPALTIPFTIPAKIGGYGLATFNVTNAGQFDVYPVFSIAAGTQGVRIENSTTGKYLYISPDVTIPGVLEVDMGLRTVNSNIAGVLTSLLGVTTGDFWALTAVATSAVRIETQSGGTQAGTIAWSPRYLVVI